MRTLRKEFSNLILLMMDYNIVKFQRVQISLNLYIRGSKIKELFKGKILRKNSRMLTNIRYLI